jgi:hypothetical protein
MRHEANVARRNDGLGLTTGLGQVRLPQPVQMMCPAASAVPQDNRPG